MTQLTKVQQRVVSKIASGAALNYINGGGVAAYGWHQGSPPHGDLTQR